MIVSYAAFQEATPLELDNSTPTSEATKISGINHLTTNIARQTLLIIIKSDTNLFIQTVTFELSHSKTAHERGIYLNVLRFVLAEVSIIHRNSCLEFLAAIPVCNANYGEFD